MKLAFVFPGQGAQKVGMGRNLYDNSPAAKAVFDAADEALGESLSQLIFEGPTEDLTLTANTQPAIVATSIAAYAAFKERCDVKPDLFAGHSLGEFSALAASDALSFADAVKTTRARGTFMQEAVAPGKGAMAAIMKLDPSQVTAACDAAAQGEVVSPANFNCPGQIVISGDSAAVTRASASLKEQGGRVIPLKVSAPFHCALMQPAAEKLDSFMKTVTFNSPSSPVVTNVEATPNSDAQKIHSLLVQQVTSTVRWTDSINYMIEQGVKTFIEFGPGNVLQGLIKKIDKSASVISAGDIASIEKAVETVNNI